MKKIYMTCINYDVTTDVDLSLTQTQKACCSKLFEKQIVCIMRSSKTYHYYMYMIKFVLNQSTVFALSLGTRTTRPQF